MFMNNKSQSRLLFKLGLDAPNPIVVAISLLVLLIVLTLQERGSVWEQVAR